MQAKRVFLQKKTFKLPLIAMPQDDRTYSIPSLNSPLGREVLGKLPI